ncbi:MAG: serine/threonine protein kinase [Myxococcota bacterium]|jgi:serine/threonine protein kinase
MVDPIVLEWSRDQLQDSKLTKLSRQSRVKPMVWLSEDLDGAKRIVKDCRGLPFYSRWLAKLIMWREYRIMLRLHGIAAVPQVRERIDSHAFSMTFMAGEPLSEENFSFAPRRISDDLLGVIEKLHERHVYHLDLRQRQNILLGDGLKAQIIDFGSSWAPWWGARMIFGKLLVGVDRSAALKYLVRFAPQKMTFLEAQTLLRGLWLRRIWIFSPYHSHGVTDTLKSIVAKGPPSTEGNHKI